MRTPLFRLSWAAVGLAAVASSGSATVLGAAKVPVISARSYVTVTISPEEVGVTVGRSKQSATAGGDGCTGTMDVK